MSMLLRNVGSQYLIAGIDADKNYFDGAKTYKCTLPTNIPEDNFWSFTVYDNQTRSMLRTPQRYPRAGSQSYPSPAAVHNKNGSVDIYFAPKAPKGLESNWIPTGEDFFLLFRLYGPDKPLFEKTWILADVEKIN